jgi:hypothetical protein
MMWGVAFMFVVAADLTPAELYQTGLDSMNDSDFSASIQAYEELLIKGYDTPAIHYNLGNAYYRNGHMGPAIVSYERALQLDPNMELARDNLRQAVNQTEKALPRPKSSPLVQWFYFWHGSLTTSSVYAVAMVGWCSAWGVLILRMFVPFRFQRRVASILFLTAIVFFGSFWIKQNPLPIAVAMGEKVPIRFGNTESDTLHFELFTGDRVLIDSEVDNWYRIETAGGKRGWARKEYFIPISPRRTPLKMFTSSKSVEQPSALGYLR